MLECMRWFGPADPVTLADIRQSGARGVVSALHDVAPDTPWSVEAVDARRAEIEAAGLTFAVVESIPVPDAVKRGAPDAAALTEVWLESLRAVAAAGVRVLCYNFMPVLDWTRTELDHPLPNGATTLRFDATAFAAFDLHILKRPGAENDHSEARRRAAAAFADRLDDAGAQRLTRAIIAGLPGGMTGGHDLGSLRDALAAYAGVDHAALLRTLIRFQAAVAPEAERLGVRLALHPDDPPRPLLGLPRAASTRSDFAQMFGATPLRANGLTWCLGSLSAGSDPVDALRIGADHARRIHFAHLRVVERDGDDPESFREAAHLEGAVDLVEAVAMLLAEERRRGGRGEPSAIPMRPDHGWRMMGDLTRRTNPGYGLYGRMRGLAELRGVAAALSRSATAEGFRAGPRS